MKLILRSSLFATILTVSQAAIADPCTAPLPSPGTDFSGQVRYVGDGDSLCVGQSNQPSTWIEIRVADFYAPELHSPGGPQAKAVLEKIAMGKIAKCQAGRKSYDRVVAQCFIGSESIGDSMRKAGIKEGGRGR